MNGSATASFVLLPIAGAVLVAYALCVWLALKHD